MGAAKILDLRTGRETASLELKGRRLDEGPGAVVFSPDGTRIAALTYPREAPAYDGVSTTVWNSATGSEIACWEWPTDVAPFCMAFSPDGERIAGACCDETVVRVWNTAKEQEPMTIRGHTEPVRCVAFSPSGERIATGSEDKTVKLWDAATGRHIATSRDHRASVESLAFSPGGRRIATGDQDGSIRLWDVTNLDQ